MQRVLLSHNLSFFPIDAVSEQHCLNVLNCVRFRLVTWRAAARTVVQERQYEGICVRLLNAKRHFNNIRSHLLNLKRDKPKMVNNYTNTTCYELTQNVEVGKTLV